MGLRLIRGFDCFCVCVFSALLLPCHAVWLEGGRLVGLIWVRLGVRGTLFGLLYGLFFASEGHGECGCELVGGWQII